MLTGSGRTLILICPPSTGDSAISGKVALYGIKYSPTLDGVPEIVLVSEL